MPEFSINTEQRLYVMPSGNGYTCLGFDVAERKRLAVLSWCGLPAHPVEIGTQGAYDAYIAAMSFGAAHARATGARCPANRSNGPVVPWSFLPTTRRHRRYGQRS